MEHTSGQVRLMGELNILAADGSRSVACAGGHQDNFTHDGGHGENAANAARLVALWNAADGLTTADAVARLAAYPKLVEACKTLYRALEEEQGFAQSTTAIHARAALAACAGKGTP